MAQSTDITTTSQNAGAPPSSVQTVLTKCSMCVEEETYTKKECPDDLPAWHWTQGSGFPIVSEGGTRQTLCPEHLKGMSETVNLFARSSYRFQSFLGRIGKHFRSNQEVNEAMYSAIRGSEADTTDAELADKVWQTLFGGHGPAHFSRKVHSEKSDAAMLGFITVAITRERYRSRLTATIGRSKVSDGEPLLVSGRLHCSRRGNMRGGPAAALREALARGRWDDQDVTCAYLD